MEKYNNSQLIKNMRLKGITFRYHKKGEAIEFLEFNNYHYKISAFRKNFSKVDGKYQNLDFSYLIDLASIDMHIRKFLMDLSIDVEHFIKVELSRLIHHNPNEDGYTIVENFKEFEDEKYYKQSLFYFERTRYQKDMYEKRHDELPIWALMEHMDYGSLIQLVMLYHSKYKSKSLKKAVYLGNNARFIRNACAHNNIISINVLNGDNKINSNSSVTSIAEGYGLLKYKDYAKINDLISLIELAKNYCSEAVLNHHRQEAKKLLNRCLRHQDNYKNNRVLKRNFLVFKKIIDNL